VDHALILLCALMLNAALAGPRRWLVALGISRLAGLPNGLMRGIERRLNREHRSAGERRMRGMLVVAGTMCVVAMLGVCGSWLCAHFNMRFAEMAVVALALPVRPSWDEAAHILRHLKTGDVAKARLGLSATAWRHYALLDAPGLSRAAIEILAVHMSEKIIAPVLWYMLLGLPGLLMSKHEALLKPGRVDNSFSKAADTLHNAAHYIPSRIAAVLALVASLFLSTGTWRRSALRLVRDMGSAGVTALPLLTSASILGLSLGGPTSHYTCGTWLGDGNPRPGTGDIRRALYLFGLQQLLLFVLIGAAL
jgi:adenosylcobinamide-phosphate synthase